MNEKKWYFRIKNYSHSMRYVYRREITRKFKNTAVIRKISIHFIFDLNCIKIGSCKTFFSKCLNIGFLLRIWWILILRYIIGKKISSSDSLWNANSWYWCTEIPMSRFHFNIRINLEILSRIRDSRGFSDIIIHLVEVLVVDEKTLASNQKLRSREISASILVQIQWHIDDYKMLFLRWFTKYQSILSDDIDTFWDFEEI